MTRPDNDELKRLAEGASAFNYDGWKYQTPSDPMFAGRIMASEHGPVIATVQWPVPMMDHVLSGVDSSRPVGAFIAAANPAVVLELLSEIEGLKARAMLADMMSAKLERRTRLLDEAERQLADLRTQAPDSWRPDRDALIDIIAEAAGWGASSGYIKAERTTDAVMSYLSALRPQTAESGK